MALERRMIRTCDFPLGFAAAAVAVAWKEAAAAAVAVTSAARRSVGANRAPELMSGRA
jgi:hypothetical protein